MKKSIKYILVALAALCFNAKAAKAADIISIPADWTLSSDGTQAWVYTQNHEQYFTWGNGRGMVLYTGQVAADKGHVIVHCKKVDGKYRFFCDEACTVECIGLSNNPSWGTHGGWYPVIDTDIPQIASQFRGRDFAYLEDGRSLFTYFDVPFSTYRNFGGTIGIKWHDTGNIDRFKTHFHSPHDISQFLHMICNATLHLGGTSFGELCVFIYMHDEYEITKNEWCANVGAIFEGKPVYVANYSSPYPTQMWNYSSDLDNGTFTTVSNTLPNRVEIIRASDYISGGPMLSVSPDYQGGKTGADTYYINFMPGNEFFGNRFVIDNATTDEKDIAIEVNHNGLLMLSHNVTTNRVARKGIGVKLASGGSHSYHNAAIELGSDIGPAGTCKIQNCNVAIDADAGVIRLKTANPSEFQIHDNDVVANIAHDVILGKWSYDISSFVNHKVTISLKNIEDWHSGDIVFSSGRTTIPGGANSRFAGQYLCPLFQTEETLITYAAETDLTRTYKIAFVTSGIPANEDYEYPCFVLDVPCIYNSRTGEWYPYLQKALTDTKKPVQDGDQLIYFGSVTEPEPCTISNSITVRSASLDNAFDVQVQVAEGRDPIDPNGYTSTYYNSASSFITVSSGANVTFGTNSSIADGKGRSGKFTIDLKNLGRAIDITNGTVNANANFKIVNGKESAEGGAIRIGANGILNLTDAEISGNNAGKSGCAIYQGGIMNVSGKPVFGGNDYVYLPVGKVITKVGALTNTAKIPVTLANEAEGRDIVVSKKDAANAAGGQVIEEDLSTRFSVILAEGSIYAAIYNAEGFDGSYTPKNVIELAAGKGTIVIRKSGLKAGDSAVFTVAVEGSSDPICIVSLTGVSDSGTEVSVEISDVIAGSYTVTEAGWSWAYKPAPGTSLASTKKVADKETTTYSFTNVEDDKAADHAESSVNNKFD